MAARSEHEPRDWGREWYDAVLGLSHESRLPGWPIDVGLAMGSLLGFLTRDIVIWVHLLFVVGIIAALVLPFRPFAIRLTVWLCATTSLLVWGVSTDRIPPEETTELPILAAVIVMVFLVARSRDRYLRSVEMLQLGAATSAERERVALSYQLEQSQRLDTLGRASTHAAHDLRNIITIVGGIADELDAESDPRYVALGAQLQRATNRGHELVDAFVLAGRRSNETKTIDLQAVLPSTAAMLRHLARDEVVVQVASVAEPIRVELDRTELLQILMNLVSNASDAIDAEGRVHVSATTAIRGTSSAPGGRSFAAIRVSDTGRGFLTEGADPFELGYTTKRDEHSGLGLSTVRQIVLRAGGSVEFESAPRNGSTVTVWLPVHEASTPPDAADTLDTGIAESAAENGGVERSGDESCLR